MDYAFKGGVLFVNVSAIQALALAVLTYYFGVWVKKHVSILEKYSIPSPVVGGILFSIVTLRYRREVSAAMEAE